MQKFILAALTGSLLSLPVQATQDDMEVITVSATRSSSSMQQTPAAIEVLSQDELQLTGHQHINQALAQVAGTWISRGNGQEHLTAIRSPVLTGAGSCGAFFMAEDGISLRAAGFCNTNQLFDANTEQAQQIEVVRGPNSVLYGSNALHGVINILTPNPFQQTSDMLQLEVGANDYLRSKFYLNKHSDKQAFGLYANLAKDGGYQEQSGFDQQKLNLVHQYDDSDFRVKTVISGSHLEQETAGFIRGFEAYKDDVLRRSNPNPEAYRNSDSLRWYSKFEWAGQQQNFHLTPYARYTDMEFLQHFLPWQPVEKNQQSSLGLKAQWQAKFELWLWFAGIDLESTDGKLSEVQGQGFSATIPVGAHYDYAVSSKIISPYIDSQWSITSKLNMELGVRYDHISYDYDNKLTTGNACAEGVDNCRFYRPQDQQRNFAHFSPRLGVNYRWRQQNIYARISQGFRAPQATELFRLQAGQQTADIQAERLNSIELGIKAGFDNFSYALSLYQMQKQHFIFQDSDRQVVDNGNTRHLGLELNLSYRFNPNWQLSYAGSLAKHEYDNQIALSRDNNIQGNRIDTAPDYMDNWRLDWHASANTLLQLERQHLGGYYLDPANSAEYGGHSLYHLRIKQQATPALSFTFRINNLLDKDYAERADFAFGSYRYFVGLPRSIFAELKYNFN